ncbi:chemotaxis protein [Pseudomonas donghuensis]|uniref:chemotaxis protein n=1 Tax=Pseudomonas donghuensis TaxID=1163398 RepID=UPI0020C26AEC|nr:chemotaxis protein [Pseudomonas donghuensis]MCP6699370.1 chemotaxis protein [Pseudomonas donghuensis]
MKLVFREYLASLRERRELDVVLPDLLSELGFNVISRPSVGTRQYGVDVAAVGRDTDAKTGASEKKLFLFSIKQGDLTRNDWDGTTQALRGSINEITDFYIPVRIAEQYKHLKVVICLCFGGEIHEAIQDIVTQFIKLKTDERVSFQIWNGDYLAGKLTQGVLQQQLIDEKLRSSFQKSVAMIDEPDIAYKHFSNLAKGLLVGEDAKPQSQLTSLRQVYICLWVLFVWARAAGNLEAPYRASERAILLAWEHIKGHISSKQKKKITEDMGNTFAELVNLHFQIWDEFLGKKVLPHVQVRHGVSASVNTSTSVDINLKLFETLGRIAQRGLWLLWQVSKDDAIPQRCLRAEAGDPSKFDEAFKLASQVRQLISNNPCLLSPIADEHSIDIGVAVTFLSMMDEWQPCAQSYCDHLLENYWFTYCTHGRYPTTDASYRNLIDHPREVTDAYRERQTKGSTLIPLMMAVATSRGETKRSQEFVTFAKQKLPHCNMQLWLPGGDSEDMLYRGRPGHGMALTDIPITADGAAAMKMLSAEISRDEHLMKMSAIEFGHWPILVMACRHYRLPLPPHLWLPLLTHARTKSSSTMVESSSTDIQ